MQRILSNWNLMRWMRLGLGLYVSYHAFVTKDAFSGMLGAFLLYQAIANVGCCGVGGCEIPTKKAVNNQIEEVEFEEIKAK